MAPFLNPLPCSFAGEIREREQAVIYQQPVRELSGLADHRTSHISAQLAPRSTNRGHFPLAHPGGGPYAASSDLDFEIGAPLMFLTHPAAWPLSETK